MAVVTGGLDFAERDDDLAAFLALGLARRTALESGDVAGAFANLQGGGGRLGARSRKAAPTMAARMEFLYHYSFD